MSFRVVRLTLNRQTFACSVRFEEGESNSAFCAFSPCSSGFCFRTSAVSEIRICFTVMQVIVEFRIIVFYSVEL